MERVARCAERGTLYVDDVSLVCNRNGDTISVYNMAEAWAECAKRLEHRGSTERRIVGKRELPRLRRGKSVANERR